MLSYTQIKWLILLVPAIVIGLWEIIRHEFLLPFISMNTGNLLSPFIVLAVTLIVNQRLFQAIERHQEELEEEKTKQAIMEERQAISRELHDSISQSLFLLGVRIDKLRETEKNEERQWQQIHSTISAIQQNVRESIKHLRNLDPVIHDWQATLQELIDHLKAELPSTHVTTCWGLREDAWTMEEKVQAYFILREALTNIIKHADQVESVEIKSTRTKSGWEFEVIDDGKSSLNQIEGPSHYGLEMMRDRAVQMGWGLHLKRTNDKTKLHVQKNGGK